MCGLSVVAMCLTYSRVVCESPVVEILYCPEPRPWLHFSVTYVSLKNKSGINIVTWLCACMRYNKSSNQKSFWLEDQKRSSNNSPHISIICGGTVVDIIALPSLWIINVDLLCAGVSNLVAAGAFGVFLTNLVCETISYNYKPQLMHIYVRRRWCRDQPN